MPERGAHAVEVALDRDVVGSDLLAVGIEKHNVGLADRSTDDIGALRRSDDRVGDFGIGDQHILHIARQVDDHGLTDAECQKARFDGRADRRRRHRIFIGLGRDDGHERSERQRRDGRQQQGAGRHGSHR